MSSCHFLLVSFDSFQLVAWASQALECSRPYTEVLFFLGHCRPALEAVEGLQIALAKLFNHQL